MLKPFLAIVILIPTTLLPGRAQMLSAIRGIRAGVAPASLTGSHTQQQANQLQLPASAFTPATITNGGALDPAAIDNAQLWPRIHHSTDYSAWGFQGAYIQTATWIPSGATDTVVFGYAGTWFTAQPGAYDAWRDGATYWPSKYSGIQAGTCPDVPIPMCVRWELTGSNGVIEWADFLQLGACLAETRAFAPAALFTAQQTQIVSTLGSIDQAAASTASVVCHVPLSMPNAPPSGPAFGLDAWRIERYGAKPDWTLKRPSPSRFEAKKPIALSVYYSVVNAAANEPAQIHMSVQAGGRVVLDEQLAPYTLSPSLSLYWRWIRFIPPGPGRYTARVKVTVGSQSETGTLSFTAHPAPAPGRLDARSQVQCSSLLGGRCGTLPGIATGGAGTASPTPSSPGRRAPSPKTVVPQQMDVRRAAAGQTQLAHVRYIRRGVTVQPPSQSPRAGVLKMPLFDQYGLRTVHDEKASIGFVDGTVLDINQDTDVVLTSPHVTTVHQGEVAEYLAPGTDHRVQAATVVAGAIGTIFDVETSNGQSIFVVKRGALQVSSGQGKPVVVKNGQQTVVSGTAAPTAPSPANVQAVFAWTDEIPAPDLGEDVALDANGGSVVSFSSQREGVDAGHADHIDDGLLTQGWESADGQTRDQWVKIGFLGGNSYAISAVIIDPAATYGDPSAADLQHFEIRVSSTGTDENSFTRVFTGTCRQQNTLQRFDFPVPVRAKYIELYMDNNYGDPHRLAVAEFEAVTTSSLFAEPSAVALGRSGAIYVADTVNNRIQKLSSSGKALRRWGSKGDGKGQFLNPAGIAADRRGDIYVADTDNDRVQKLSPRGKVLAVWGTSGQKPGQFFDPQGIAVDQQGNIYVADTFNHRIQKLSPTGTVLDVWGMFGTAPGQFADPEGVAIDGQGNIYVADSNNNRIQKLGPLGNVLEVWGTYGSGLGQLSSPSGLAVDPFGNIDVADQFNARIQKFSPQGQPLIYWGTFGVGPGALRLPWGPTIDAIGNVYVADRFNGRIVKFSPLGAQLAAWGKFATIPQILGQPGGLAVDPQGNVDVVDRTNDRVQQRDAAGNVRVVWGYHGEWTFQPSKGIGQFWYPIGIAVDGNSIYVGDTLNDRIQILSPDGPQGVFGSTGSGPGQFLLPWGVAVDAQHRIYVVDYGNSRVERFSPQGQFQIQWGAFGAGAGQFDKPLGIVVDGSGNVYIADSGNRRIEKFSADGTFLGQWGPLLSGYGRLFLPSALAADSAGNIYIGDESTVIKVAPTGKVLQTILLPMQGTGSRGVTAGIALDPQGDIFVTDMQNSRIVKFAPGGQVLAVWS